MRYIDNKTNVYVFLLDIDPKGFPHGPVRFASYDSRIVPEVGEIMRGPFGYYGAEIEAEVVSSQPSGEPIGIAHEVQLRFIEDGKCFYCRSDTEEHNKLDDKHPCPADARMQEAIAAEFGV